MELHEIENMLKQAAAAEEPKKDDISSASTSTSTGSGNAQRRPQGDSNAPNIYSDISIEPLEIDKTKLKSSWAYAVVAIDENPPAEMIEVLNKIVDILKAKRFVYRYNGDIKPTLANSILKRQDLSMPDSYQVFLFMPPKTPEEYEGITIESKRPSIMAGRIAKHFTKYTKKDENNPEIKNTHYGFSTMPGVLRNILSNNIHMYLGKDCLTKLNFLILYSADGVEKVSEINRDTTNRRAGDAVRIAEAAGIPVFNIGKADGTKRLLEFINKD